MPINPRLSVNPRILVNLLAKLTRMNPKVTGGGPWGGLPPAPEEGVPMGSMGAVLGETAGTLRAFVGLHLWPKAQGPRPMAPPLLWGEIHSREARGGECLPGCSPSNPPRMAPLILGVSLVIRYPIRSHNTDFTEFY